MHNLFRSSKVSATLLALGVTASAVTSAITSASVLAQDATPPGSTPTPTSPTDVTPPSSTPTPTSPTDVTPPSSTPTPTSPTDVTPPASSPSITAPTDTTPPASSPGITAPATSTTNFSDVSQDYWALPFIQALAQRNVIVGFPDGTYKPDQPVTRAQFAAMIQKAFSNQNSVRQLPANGFKDVPSNYWGAAAIQKAYETGFMAGYPGNLFLPNQQIPKVQALVALTSGLSLNASGVTPDTLSTYYTDASGIPNYALNNVAAATQTNIVVNYPDVKTLNPQTAITRAEAAALLFQALVKQGQLQPLASNVAANQYVVGRSSGTQTGSTTGNDIVALTASSNSFTTLTSLLKAAGLTDALQQQGPFTVFAPTDQAFAALPKGTVDRLQLPENKDYLVKILSYHVLSGAVPSTQLANGDQKTLEGSSIKVKVPSKENQPIKINNAKVIQANVQASNGLIYAVDKVLLPPDFKISQLKGKATASTGGNGGGPSIGRATRGGRSYIGIGANFGISGDSALSDTNFTVISKLGITRNFSIRPSAVIGDSPVVLVPITYDFAPRSYVPGGFPPIAPYIGAGVAIDTGNDGDVGALITGGIDVPLGRRFTANGSINAAFLNDTDVGIVLGIGYNF
ncbi:MAG: S-layer homology domain-containing protein [Rhizonema sp. PD37]|nr:S-layer homology domain-containing protein [Rhizonema sp. PD37]